MSFLRRVRSNTVIRSFCSTSTSSGRPLNVCIVAARRTPIGAFRGSLSHLSATQLGSIVIEGVLKDAKMEPKLVEEVYMGNVLSAGLGQAPARQAALGAGLGTHSVCTTVNKVCASGMKAVMLGAQSIMLGMRKVVVAGGMESMSNAPYLLQRTFVKRLGNVNLLDSLMHDGLTDSMKGGLSMGVFAEKCAAEMGISRDEQDDHAIQSYERAVDAQSSGAFKEEIIPVTIPGKKGQKDVLLDFDEECTKFDPDKLECLPPVFKDDGGTVTAGNSSPISDGACALLLTSREYAEANKLQILAHIRGFADAEQAPEDFPTSPTLALPLAAEHAGLHLQDIDLFEINEAFSVVDLANRKLLGLQPEIVNVHGGAVSLGHPIGASGARIIRSLVSALAMKNLKFGAAAVCNGGGGASAIIIERDKDYTLNAQDAGQGQ